VPRIAAEHDVPPAPVALAWLLAKPRRNEEGDRDVDSLLQTANRFSNSSSPGLRFHFPAKPPIDSLLFITRWSGMKINRGFLLIAAPIERAARGIFSLDASFV
jgi:hypothetical protein